MKFLRNRFFPLYMLHALHDGFEASLILLLPFIAKGLSLNLTEIGFLGTVYNSSTLLLTLPASYIALKIGGMRTLLIALVCYGVGFVGFYFAKVYLLLIPLFILAGMGTGVFNPTSVALVAKWAESHARGRLLGNFSAAGELGKSGIAAVFTFVVVIIGWQHTALYSGIIALAVAGIVFLFYFPKIDSAGSPEIRKTKLNFLSILRNKKFFLATMATFFDSFASKSLFVFLPFLFLAKGVDLVLIGSFAAAFFIGTFSGKIIFGRLIDKFESVKVYVICEILMAAVILLLANTNAPVLLIIYSIILGIFTKGTVPIGQSMTAEVAEKHGNFEKVFSVRSFIVYIAVAVSPVFFGFISDSLGISAAFYMMAIFALIAIVPAIAFRFARV